MERRVVVVLGSVGLLVVSACGVPDMDGHFVSDSLQTGAYEIQRLLQEKPDGLTTAEMEAVFVRHHEASVSPIWLDDVGRPVDAWGTHFRVEYGTVGSEVWVRCKSAGLDRAFETSDDLLFDTRER